MQFQDCLLVAREMDFCSSKTLEPDQWGVVDVGAYSETLSVGGQMAENVLKLHSQKDGMKIQVLFFGWTLWKS